jgi:putative hydrolase of the HAD superfamily
MFHLAIFDFNGTVIDDEPAWEEAHMLVFQKHGIDPAGVHHKPGIGIANNWIIFRKQFKKLSEISLETLEEETFQAYIDQLSKDRKYRSGFKSFWELLLSKQMPVVLATSLDRDILDQILPYFSGLEEKFEVIVTGDEVNQKKPAPDIFLKVLERFNKKVSDEIAASECIVFEDAVAGVQAALTAGMHVVYLPSSEFIEESNVYLQPDLVAKDFTDKRIIEFMA